MIDQRDSVSTDPSRRIFLTGAAAAAMACTIDIGAGAGGRTRALTRVTPGEVGIDAAGVIAFIDAVERSVGGLHSFMLLRHGKVAAEGWWAPYRPSYPHMLYSLSKSFTSTAVGLVVSDNRLNVEAPVVSFFADKVPANPGPNLAAMQVKHLLMMSTGHDKDATGPVTSATDGDWVKAFFSLPVEHAPGSKFVYNSAATYMLSAIVQKLTGQTVLDYLTPRLFEPLGIRGATWEKCPRGINTGGWGLAIKTEDIARFGQCFLQKGQWDGRQVVPSAWVEEATSKHISNGTGNTSDWTQGYGYQFWRCRNGAVRGDGAFGQYCVMMPEQDAVLAITSGVGDMQAVLNAAWDRLLPAMRTGTSTGESTKSLAARLASLEVTPPSGPALNDTAARVTGKTYRLETSPDNYETVTFLFDVSRPRIIFKGSGTEREIVAGSSRWAEGRYPLSMPITPARVTRTAACAGWTSTDTFAAKVCYVETPYIETFACRFEGDRVTIDRQLNVSFGPTKRPTLNGRWVNG